jgi:anhydro-N-acetylmuramic acid kinase
MANSPLYIGLISGTSVDGVDCALVSFGDDGPQLMESYFAPCPELLRDRVLMLCRGERINLPELGSVDIEVARFFAEATLTLISQAGIEAGNVAAIGSHGQTVWHQPTGDSPFTLQLGDPNTLATLTGIVTVGDLRRMDMAAGGEGAPLAPLLHQQVFARPGQTRAVINLGGIANVTLLPAAGDPMAFDTGPANVLMDYWIGKHQNLRCDENGAWAATGQTQQALLQALKDEPYFQQPFPKSTGRELFNGNWLEQKLAGGFAHLAAQDVQATLLALTAETVADALLAGGDHEPYPSAAVEDVYICGGGAHNGALMRALAKALDCPVKPTSELGVDPDWVEAMAFAWMARERIAGRPIDTSHFTGAKHSVCLGGIYQPTPASS